MAPPTKSKPAPPAKPAAPRTPLDGSTPGEAVPKQVSGSETTLFLDIDLKNGATPLTAVHLPGPLPAGPLDLLVYLHGYKRGSLDGVALADLGADKFLTVKSFDFRAMIRGTKKRQFALVVPTLGNKSQAGELVKTGANFDLFLDMVFKGIEKHLPAAATPTLGNLILAAHSGGGEPLYSLVKNATAATKGKLREVWGFDCTYGHGQDWVKLLTDTAPGTTPPTKLLPALVKLWVVSTGMAKASRDVLQDPKLPKSATNPVVGEEHYDSGTGDQAHVILAHAQKSKATNIEGFHAGLFHWDAGLNKLKADHNYVGYAFPSGHNECVGENLPALLTRSVFK